MFEEGTEPAAEEFSVPEYQAPEAPVYRAPAAPVTEAPVIPNVVVQAAPTSEKTEQLLSELLGKFSYDAMMQEIRRSVREELEKILLSNRPDTMSAVISFGLLKKYIPGAL